MILICNVIIRYERNRVNRAQTKIYWRCRERLECGGSVMTNFNVSAGIFIVRGKAHTHEPDFADIRVKEIVRGIKRRAMDEPNAPPSSIFRDAVSNVTDEQVIATLPQRNDLIRTINRVQNRNRPINPQSVKTFSLKLPITEH